MRLFAPLCFLWLAACQPPEGVPRGPETALQDEAAVLAEGECPRVINAETVARAFQCRVISDHPDWTVKELAPGLSRVTVGEIELEVSIANLEAQCVTSEDCPGVLDRWFQTLETMSRPRASGDAGDLRLLVRAGAQLAAHEQRAGKPLARSPCLGADFDCVLVIDTPGAVRYLDREALQAMGLEEALARRRALSQTLAEPTQLHPLDIGVYVIRPADFYSVSRLLDTKFWQQLPVPLKGKPVVLPAGGDAVYVTGTEEPALAKLRERAASLSAQQPTPLTDQFFVWENNDWQPLASVEPLGEKAQSGSTAK